MTADVFTSAWSQYTGPGRIGICTGRPRGAPAGFRMYAPLAPGWDIIRNSPSQAAYRKRYFGEILAPLDPQKTLDDLRRLAAGHPPVLLCFEKAPLHEGNWCHRTMIGEWLVFELGITVREWSGSEDLPLLSKVGALP